MNLKKVATLLAIAGLSTSAFATNGDFSHGYGTKSKGMAGVGIAYGQVTLAAATTLTSAPALSYDGDWKRGRIYYRAICSSCHATTPVGVIQPNGRTKAEWAAYLKADKHEKGKDSVTQFFSKAYLDGIKGHSKAAAKFATVPSEQLLKDVQIFLERSAKDGAAPASCS